jgi:hypothetical protein
MFTISVASSNPDRAEDLTASTEDEARLIVIGLGVAEDLASPLICGMGRVNLPNDDVVTVERS